MVIALATVEESVRAYLRDKRFPWDFDFFSFSLFERHACVTDTMLPSNAKRSAENENGEKIVKSRANLISGDYPGSYGKQYTFHVLLN